VLASIVAGSATVGAIIAALFSTFGANGSPRALVAGGFEGAVIGLGIGLVLAMPAAIIVWLLTRSRH
jgi:hypothetical protein